MSRTQGAYRPKGADASGRGRTVRVDDQEPCKMTSDGTRRWRVILDVDALLDKLEDVVDDVSRHSDVEDIDVREPVEGRKVLEVVVHKEHTWRCLHAHKCQAITGHVWRGVARGWTWKCGYVAVASCSACMDCLYSCGLYSVPKLKRTIEKGHHVYTRGTCGAGADLARMGG